MAAVRPAAPAILYDDAAVLAIDKPAGWLVDDDGPTGVLGWARRYEQAAGRRAEEVRLAHRLDRDTSGVLVLARSEEAARRLGAAFAGRRVYKIYVALTAPVPAVRWARVDHLLAGRRVGALEKMVIVAEGGQQATSEVEVVARSRRFGLVRVLPEQGRKHQVRVAVAELGAPIAGDFLYGGPRVARLAARVMLHALALDLAHPLTEGVHLALRAPLPEDLRQLFQDDGGVIPAGLDRRHAPSKAAAPSGRGAKAR